MIYRKWNQSRQKPYTSKMYNKLNGNQNMIARHRLNAFFRSQLSFCRLIWMCHSKPLNKIIKWVDESWWELMRRDESWLVMRVDERWWQLMKGDERCLRIIYNNKGSSFKRLLDQDRSVSIHTQNLQKPAIKMSVNTLLSRSSQIFYILKVYFTS